jgi:hypothetical protein
LSGFLINLYVLTHETIFRNKNTLLGGLLKSRSNILKLQTKGDY